MPEVRNLGADVNVRGYGRYEGGETHSVSRAAAEYLTSERDFVVVKDDDGSGDDAPEKAEGDLSELTHDELKARAEAEGIADDIDLRSKESIIDALEG